MEIIIFLVIIFRMVFVQSYSETEETCVVDPSIKEICARNVELSSTSWALNSIKADNAKVHTLIMADVTFKVDVEFSTSMDCNKISTNYGKFELNWYSFGGIIMQKTNLLFNVGKNDVVVIGYQLNLFDFNKIEKTCANLKLNSRDDWTLKLRMLIGNSPRNVLFSFRRNDTMNNSIQEEYSFDKNELRLDPDLRIIEWKPKNQLLPPAQILEIVIKERDTKIAFIHQYKMNKMAFGVIVTVDVFFTSIFLINLFLIFRHNQVAPA